jgi:hypothetical protein
LPADPDVVTEIMMRLAVLSFIRSFFSGRGSAPINSQSPPKVDRPLDPEVLEEISVVVRTGVHDNGRLMAIFREEMYAPGEFDESSVAAAIEAARKEWEQEKEQWPEVTDCDRLDEAFEAINTRGIIAIQNAGYTQSDGYHDFREAYARHPKKSEVLGYCFYHGQDLERAVRGGGLYLAFGPTDPTDEQARGLLVGNVVRDELTRVGLAIEWDGTFATRMHLPDYVWQRR